MDYLCALFWIWECQGRTASFSTNMVPGQLLGSGVPTKDDQYSINWRNNIISVIITRARDRMKANLKPNILSWIILKKKLSVISKLFPLNCIFHYISNCSKVLEFCLTSFFNLKSWRVKFRNLELPVH